MTTIYTTTSYGHCPTCRCKGATFTRLIPVQLPDPPLPKPTRKQLIERIRAAFPVKRPKEKVKSINQTTIKLEKRQKVL